jgi:shikimate dehydrogenase
MAQRETISGRSSVFVIVADPVHHVKTPQLFNTVLAERGIDGVLVPLHVPPASLKDTMRGLSSVQNLSGVVVTVPHKSAVVALCDEVSLRARRCDAVNVVRRNTDGSFSGENFDGFGFVQGLVKAGIDPKDRRIFLAGAGGAAKAIAVSLGERGFERLTLHNRTHASAAVLRERLCSFYPGANIATGNDPSGHDIVINATSLGMHDDDPPPLDASRLTPDMAVAEVIMQPRETVLLRAAAERGCRVHFGLAMLEEQINLLVDFLASTTTNDSRGRE